MSAMSELDMTHGDMRRHLVAARLSLSTAATLLDIERGNAVRAVSSEYEDIVQIHELVLSALAYVEMAADDIGTR